MHKHLRKSVVTVAATGALLAAAAPAIATTSSFGPQSWAVGSATGRYRAHTGYHYITLGCSSGRFIVDLRVDVINNPDVSEGRYTYTCGITGQLYGHYDSYLTSYRGHFMQNGSSFYGSMKDSYS